jgi:hypothetical protein
MGTGVDADRGTGSAAKAREPRAAPLFRRASALALIGMAAFTDIVITRRRAGWPVRRVSMRSRVTRQSPAYAPCDAFADVSAAPPAIASADTARRIRFITAFFFHAKSVNAHRRKAVLVDHRNFKFPELAGTESCNVRHLAYAQKAAVSMCSAKADACFGLKADIQHASQTDILCGS